MWRELRERERGERERRVRQKRGRANVLLMRRCTCGFRHFWPKWRRQRRKPYSIRRALEEEEGVFKAPAMNDVDAGRDCATPVERRRNSSRKRHERGDGGGGGEMHMHKRNVCMCMCMWEGGGEEEEGLDIFIQKTKTNSCNKPALLRVAVSGSLTHHQSLCQDCPKSTSLTPPHPLISPYTLIFAHALRAMPLPPSLSPSLKASTLSE